MIRLVVLIHVRFPLSLRNVEDLLFERGIDLRHETVWLRWNRFRPMFAADIRRLSVSRMRGFRHWRCYLDEVYIEDQRRDALSLARHLVDRQTYKLRLSAALAESLP